MKVRNGFVSNSSSSSFVLAVRSDATEEQIKEVFYNDKKTLRSFLEYNLEYVELSQDPDGDMDVAIDVLVKDLAESIAQDMKNGMKLGEWVVFSGTCGNEDYGTPLYIYLYSEDVVYDILKVKLGD
jgi:hypothetical protein